MLPFFRKIRWRLATKNQFFSYSRYAIGEIVLVVVGILIALQINNWNEERKSQILESNFLQGLSSDLAMDIIYYKDRIKDSKLVIRSNTHIIREMYKEQSNMLELKMIFKDLRFPSEQLTTQNSTYVELINSGNLNLIRNETLKRLIIQYYRENERVSKHVEEYNASSVQFFQTMAENNSGFERMMSFNDEIFSNMEFSFEKDWAYLNDPYSKQFKILEQTLVIYINKHKTFLNYFEQLNQLAKKLNSETNLYLDKPN